MSNPPHRDFPIEWRTDTGEFIGQTARGQASVGPPPAEQPPQDPPSYGRPQYGQYSQPIYDQPPGQTPSGWTPDSQPPPPPPTAPGSAAAASADEFLAIQPADHGERRVAVRLRMGILVLAVLGILAAWATGGLDKAPGYVADEGVKTVAVGESVDTGPFRMSVHAAAVFDEYGDVRPLGDEGDLLIVKMTMEILGDRTAGIGLDTVTLDGVSGLTDNEPMRIVLERDTTSGYYLQPGLPEQVAYIWQLLPGTAAPDDVRVVMKGATWRRTNFSFINEWDWWDPGPRAATTVPVEDRRAAQ